MRQRKKNGMENKTGRDEMRWDDTRMKRGTEIRTKPGTGTLEKFLFWFRIQQIQRKQKEEKKRWSPNFPRKSCGVYARYNKWRLGWENAQSILKHVTLQIPKISGLHSFKAI